MTDPLAILQAAGERLGDMPLVSTKKRDLSVEPVADSKRKRRKVLEHKKLVAGNPSFGIRLAEVEGEEDDLTQPRIIVASLSRSGKLEAGDRCVVLWLQSFHCEYSI